MALETKAAHRKDLNAGIGPMEHRHFATIATILREMPETMNGRTVINLRDDMAEYFADRLRYSNPRFDRDRFLRACAG